MYITETIKADDFAEIYHELLVRATMNSDTYGKLKYIMNINFVLTNPIKALVPLRKNWAWALHEGVNRLSDIQILNNPGTAYKFRPNWARKLEKEGGRFHYSYGEEYKDQIDVIVKKLRSKSQREAIINVWGRHHLINSIMFNRRPCTLTIHFLPINNKLNCIVNMRTVDIMNMLPYDVFHHTLLQRYIATITGYDLGYFIFNASTGYYQKKRDITNSVNNTIDKLVEAEQIEYTNDWSFNKSDITNLEEIIINEIPIENMNHTWSSEFAKNYGHVLLYLNSKNNLNLELKEFNVINI